MKYAARSIDCGYTRSLAVAHAREEALIFLSKEDNFNRSMNLFYEEEQKLDPVHPEQVVAVATSTLLRGVDPVAVSGSRDGTIQVWDQRDCRFLRKAKPRAGVVLSIAIHLDKKAKSLIMIGYSDGVVVFWDLNGDRLHMQTEEHFGWVNDVCMSNHSVQVVAVSAGSDGIVYSWDIHSKKRIHRLQHDNIVMAVAVASRDIPPVIATGCVDTIVRVWDEETGVLLRIMDRHYDSILSLAFWEGSEILLISGSADASLRVWDILSGESVVTLLSHTDYVTNVAISRQPVPSILSTSSDGTLRIWDLAAIIEDYYRSTVLCLVYGIGKRNDRPAHDAAVTSTAATKHSSYIKDVIRENNFNARLSGNQSIMIRKDVQSNSGMASMSPKQKNAGNEKPTSQNAWNAAVAPAGPGHKPPAVAAPKVTEKKKGRVSPEEHPGVVPVAVAPLQQSSKHKKEVHDELDAAARQKKLEQAQVDVGKSTTGNKQKSDKVLSNKLDARGVEIGASGQTGSQEARLTKAIITESEVQDERRKQSILRVKEQAAEKLKQRLDGKSKAVNESRTAVATSTVQRNTAYRNVRKDESSEEEEGSSEEEEGSSEEGSDEDGSYEDDSEEEDSEND